MVLSVFLYSLLADLATGLGALPLLFVSKVSKRLMGAGNAVAAGFMASASVLLMYKGSQRGSLDMAAGLIIGVAAIWLVETLIHRSHFSFSEAVGQADVKKMLLVVGVMTLHSFSEGVGMGVAFSETKSFGLLIALSIAVQNIPEGLAISLVLVPRGVKVSRAAAWSIFSSLPQPIMAVLAFLFVQRVGWLLPAGLGFAAGAMLWMVVFELLPEAGAKASWPLAASSFTASMAAMFAILYLLGA